MKYGFIGCGNMGGAIAKALRSVTEEILIADPSPVAQNFAAEIGCECGTNEAVASGCDRVFLAVKPQMMAGVLSPIAQLLREKQPVIITIAAGLEISAIQEMIGASLPVIRLMPNTPVSVAKGMIAYSSSKNVSEEILNDFLDDMRFAGRMDALPEKLIDAASALSGSGPAYLYMFLEAMADGAVACGLPRQKAMEYAAATMEGAACMYLSSGKHPGELKDAVCSPGGSTIVGVQQLEKHGFRGAVMDCVIAAYHKNKELGK